MRHQIKKQFRTAAVALLVMPTSVAGQTPDLRPISEYYLLPEDSRDAAYPVLRCIGLFQGMFRYGGANFSDEQTHRTQVGNESMGLLALLIRQQKHPEIDVDDLATQIGVEIEAISVVYNERMTRNFSLTGEAWGSDTVILDDFETCGPIVQYAVDLVSKNSEQ